MTMYRILFVDDEAIIREGVSENVPWEELGFELAGICQHGREACDFLKDHQIDVVITDICMPYMDGMELSDFLQSEYPNIKVLILSGYDDFDYAKKAIKYGVEEYILKPVTSFELGEILTEMKTKLDKEREEEHKRNDIYSTYRKGQILLCNEALQNLIMGTRSEDECVRELEKAGIVLDDSDYLVGVAGLSIYMGDYELIESRKKESALMAFIVYNLSHEIMNDHKAGEACQGKDHRVFLLFRDGCEADMDRVRKICGEIIDKVNETMGLLLNIGLGTFRKGIKYIYRSYEQAEKSLLLQYAQGDNCIIEYIEDACREAALPQIERVEDNVIRHIREYEIKKLGEDCTELMEMLKQSGLQRGEITDLFLHMKRNTDALLKRLGVDGWHPDGEKEQEMVKASFMEQAVLVLGAYFREAAELLDRNSGSGSRSFAYQAMEYIEKNYADSNLSLQQVCNYLGMSASRFSSVFKQTFGATFMDVIIGIRMKKARELLEMTELKSYEIAEKIGFSDPHYFSIAFKKATGRTPTEYARSMKSGGQEEGGFS